jgi:hypothetical protein
MEYTVVHSGGIQTQKLHELGHFWLHFFKRRLPVSFKRGFSSIHFYIFSCTISEILSKSCSAFYKLLAKAKPENRQTPISRR